MPDFPLSADRKTDLRLFALTERLEAQVRLLPWLALRIAGDAYLATRLDQASLFYGNSAFLAGGQGGLEAAPQETSSFSPDLANAAISDTSQFSAGASAHVAQTVTRMIRLQSSLGFTERGTKDVRFDPTEQRRVETHTSDIDLRRSKAALATAWWQDSRADVSRMWHERDNFVHDPSLAAH